MRGFVERQDKNEKANVREQESKKDSHKETKKERKN